VGDTRDALPRLQLASHARSILLAPGADWSVPVNTIVPGVSTAVGVVYGSKATNASGGGAPITSRKPSENDSAIG
jgi:hypothetical protein